MNNNMMNTQGSAGINPQDLDPAMAPNMDSGANPGDEFLDLLRQLILDGMIQPDQIQDVVNMAQQQDPARMAQETMMSLPPQQQGMMSLSPQQQAKMAQQGLY